MRNRDLRPAAKANPTIQQAFERFQKYNRLKNLSQGSLDFYAAKGRSFFRFLGDMEQPITRNHVALLALPRSFFSIISNCFGSGVSQWLVCGICRHDDLLHSLFQKAFLKGCDRHFAQNRKKIFVQRVRVMRIGGFFYGIPLGVQPYLSQCFKSQVGSFQIVETSFRFFSESAPA